MDKQLLIIIIFLGITFSLVGLFSMGAIPELYRQGDQLDQALMQQHEDEARANQTLHEDEARDKQYAMENQARDKQRDQIVKETNKSLDNLEQRLYKFFNISAERAERGQQERKLIIDNVLSVFNKQDVILGQMGNLTQQIYDLLKRADERNYAATTNNTKILSNLTEELKAIKTVHKEIKEKIESIISNTIKNK